MSSQCTSQDPYSTVPFIHNVSSPLNGFHILLSFWNHSKLIFSFNHTIASSFHHSPLPGCSAHFHIFSLCSLCIALYPSPIPLHSHTSCRQPVSVLSLVTQSCLTLCYPKDCSLSVSSVPGDSPGWNTGVGYHVLLQGIFPTQGSTQVSHIAGRFFTV